MSCSCIIKTHIPSLAPLSLEVWEAWCAAVRGVARIGRDWAAELKRPGARLTAVPCIHPPRVWWPGSWQEQMLPCPGMSSCPRHHVALWSCLLSAVSPQNWKTACLCLGCHTRPLGPGTTLCFSCVPQVSSWKRLLKFSLTALHLGTQALWVELSWWDGSRGVPFPAPSVSQVLMQSSHFYLGASFCLTKWCLKTRGGPFSERATFWISGSVNLGQNVYISAAAIHQEWSKEVKMQHGPHVGWALDRRWLLCCMTVRQQVSIICREQDSGVQADAGLGTAPGSGTSLTSFQLWEHGHML